MESFSKPTDKSFSKRSKRPPSSKAFAYKDPTETSFHGSENRLKSILNSTAANKLNNSFNYSQKPSKKETDTSFSRHHDSSPYGKENKSQSPGKKKKTTTRQHNRSMVQASPPKKGLSGALRKLSQEKNLTAHNSSEKKNKAHHKAYSGQTLDSSGTLHRRYNSSMVGYHSRAGSQEERKSSHISRNMNNVNNSMFNNSSMLDDPMNFSREYSYLKDYDTTELVHFSDLAGLYNTSNNSTLKLAGLSEKINAAAAGSPNEDNLPSTQNDDEYGFQDPSKSLFKRVDILMSLLVKCFRAEPCSSRRDMQKLLMLKLNRSFKDSLQYEEESSEALYFLGVSYLWIGQYQNAKEELTKLIEREGTGTKCSVFILLSSVYKKLDDMTSAIKTLTKAITNYPERPDTYIFRAKLYLKSKNWERALSDFKQAVRLDPNRVIGYIGQGDAYRMMGEYSEAVSAYTKAINLETPLSRVAFMKRGLAFIELRKYEEAMSDLDKVIEEEPHHSEAHYYKGLVLGKKGDPGEAILCFEQAVKYNSSKKAVAKALYEITRLKIEGRNFYEASHTIHRAELLGLDQVYFTKLKLFTEGVIFLMKKKFDDGVNNLTNVLKYHLSSSLLPMIYNYRAYGHFCCGKIKKALQDYQEVQKLSKLNKTGLYNKLLCEGIIDAEIGNFDVAMANFDKALKIYKTKMEPYFYKATLTIQAFRKSHQKSDKTKQANCLSSALKHLDVALKMNDNCSNLYYTKAQVLYAMGDLDLAYANIEKAIEKADDNYAKYYFLKGAIYGAAGNYYNAISDLSIAINLDKNYRLAYLERGKCYFTFSNIKQAFLDITKYGSIKGNDPNIHLWAGNLLFNTGAYEDAARAYSNSENISKSEKLLILRAKCYIVIKELNLALADLDRLIDLHTPNNIHYHIDKECLSSLKLASLSVEGEESLDSVNLVKAIQTISKILSYKMSGEIFHLDDLYFYKSVFHFYLKEYDQALDDLDTAWEFRQELNIILKNRNMKKEQSEDNIKVTEESHIPSSVEKKSVDETEKTSSFNRLEYYYNRAIYLLMVNRYKESIAALEKLKEQPLAVSPATQQKVDNFIKVIQMQTLRELKEKDPFSDLTKAKPQEIVIFPSHNRLCSIFPLCKLPLGSNKPYVLSVENRPEAPWIKRNPEGVVFTEDLLQKEEKEIADLKGIIAANGLKEEDIYRSLGNSVKYIAEADEVIESNTGTDQRQQAIPTSELLANNLPGNQKNMKRSNT